MSRVAQPIDVVNPQPANRPLTNQGQHEFVRSFENIGVFDTDCGQVIDVEEAAIVDFVSRDVPEAQPIRLGVQELLQTIEAMRLALDPVEVRDRRSNGSAHGRTRFHQRGEPFLHDLLLTLAFPDPRSVGLGAQRKMIECCDYAG